MYLYIWETLYIFCFSKEVEPIRETYFGKRNLPNLGQAPTRLLQTFQYLDKSWIASSQKATQKLWYNWGNRIQYFSFYHIQNVLFPIILSSFVGFHQKVNLMKLYMSLYLLSMYKNRLKKKLMAVIGLPERKARFCST